MTTNNSSLSLPDKFNHLNPLAALRHTIADLIVDHFQLVELLYRPSRQRTTGSCDPKPRIAMSQVGSAQAGVWIFSLPFDRLSARQHGAGSMFQAIRAVPEGEPVVQLGRADTKNQSYWEDFRRE
jgi:hypothetical protein